MEHVKIIKKDKYLLAQFKDTESLKLAAASLVEKGFKFEAHSPFPIHGLTKIMKLKDSSLGIFAWLAGFLTPVITLAVFFWMSNDYPINHSGKPEFSIQPMFLATFEVTMIVTGTTILLAFIGLCGLPNWYHVLFSSERFKMITDDCFALTFLESKQVANIDEIKSSCLSLGAVAIEIVEGEA